VTIRRLLVVTAVDAERDAVLRGLRPEILEGSRGRGRNEDPSAAVVVVPGGVGPAAAAATCARMLASAQAAGAPFEAAVSAGVAGGFVDRVRVGGTVLGTRSIAADLGAESPDGFLTLDQLGFGSSTVEADGALLAVLRTALPEAGAGDVLTVCTVTGTATGADALLRRWPTAVAEAMEGFGVATAATQAGIGFAELRAISNPVGPRDRDAWRIGDALAALTTAASGLASLVS
jgi:futalosine hydrolase